MKEYEELNQKLRDDLKDSSHQLQMRGNELAKSRSELQSHRKEIDVNVLRHQIITHRSKLLFVKFAET